jgi:hypothetical protein
VWLKAQKSRRIGKHRTRVRLSETFAAQQFEKLFGMPPPQVRIVLAFIWAVAKVAPTIDDLLGGTAADAQLQTSTSDEIRSAGVLRHVMRILIPHVDDGRANFNLSRFGADRREQREGRRQLLREVMNAEVGSVHSQAFGLYCEIDGLQDRIGRRLRP